RDERSIGTQWNVAASKHLTINPPFFHSFRVGFDASTHGQVGLQSNLAVNAGSINASVPVDLFFARASNNVVHPGDQVILETGFSFDNAASFRISVPSLSYD